MKKYLFLSAVAAIFSSAGLCSAAEIRMQTGLMFDWWADNQISDVRQVSVPFTITGQLNDFSFKLLTAYTDTHLERSGTAGNSSLGHLLDTKLCTSYQIIDKLPVDILLGLDFNLPTGKTNLRQRDLALIMDPDLVSINNFGEGFDINPTISLAKEWGNWVTGIGFGYLWRGSYDFSKDINITDYQPGDIYNINAELRYFFSPDMYARLFGSHAWYGPDTVRGRNYFQEGDFTQFGFGLNYSREKKWEVGATFRGILREKIRFQNSPGVLVTESNDRQGDEWILDLAGKYLLDEKTVLSSNLQGRYFTHNDYATTSPFYVGAREKLSLGIGITRALGTHFEAGLDVKGFLKHDDQKNFPQTTNSRDFRGVSVSLMFAGSF